MPLLSFERANQWVPLDFMLKTDKMKLPLHEFSFVKATAPILRNHKQGESVLTRIIASFWLLSQVIYSDVIISNGFKSTRKDNK